MPLDLPNLDDRTFTDLVEEARSMIPRYAPDWTNHNPADPGITLIELLAYFTELLLFRLNRVTRENQIRFLQLLNGPAWEGWQSLEQASPEAFDAAIIDTVLKLRFPQRAVTREDYVHLALQATAANAKHSKVIRAHCEVQKNLEAAEAVREENLPGHVSVVVVPEAKDGGEPDELEGLLNQVRDYLEPKRLLTTRLHVIGPCYLWVSLGIDAQLEGYAEVTELQAEATRALQCYFSPLPGEGPDGQGWPFGRSLYLSEVFDVLEQVSGIESVRDVRVLQLATSAALLDDNQAALGIQPGIRSTVGVNTCLGAQSAVPGDRLVRNESGQLVAILLRSYELIRIVIPEAGIHLSGFAGASTGHREFLPGV